MRKRYLVAFGILLAIAILTPLVRRNFYPTPLQRLQDFAAGAGTRKAVVFIGDSLVELAKFSPTSAGCR
jgi:hypothetical protein